MWKDDGWLLDILNNARDLATLTAGVAREAFDHDVKLQRAVFWHLVVIGEAARKVSDEFKQAHPEIPWKRMMGMRNVLVHQYFEIKLEHVWEAVTVSVPVLIQHLTPLIPKQADGTE